MALHEPTVTRVALRLTFWGAAAFAVCSTLNTLFRSGNWYFPVIHEALSFVLSFTPLLAVNALAAIAAYAGDWPGHKPTLFHRAFLFGAFVPVFVMATVTWSCVTAWRDARAGAAPPREDIPQDR